MNRPYIVGSECEPNSTTLCVAYTADIRIFAYGEDFHALRLVSELPDLRAGNANLMGLSQIANLRQPLAQKSRW